MKKVRYLAYLLLSLSLSAEAGVLGKITSKIGTGLIGGAAGAAVAKNQNSLTVEENISKIVDMANKSYTYPVKVGEFTYLIDIRHKDRTLIYTYAFNADSNELSVSEKNDIKKAVTTDIHNFYNAQCQNKIIYDTLLSKGALLRYEFYYLDKELVQSKTLSVSDCRF